MKRIIKTIGAPLLGIVIVFSGFVYDVLFAGIPYQNPTPELQAQYDFHSSVADLLYKTGGIILTLGLIAIPMIWLRTKKKSTNQQVDPIVTTPVDKVEAQSTQSHP